MMTTVGFGGVGDFEFGPGFPAAYPVEGRAGLLEEMPVRLRGNLPKNLIR